MYHKIFDFNMHFFILATSYILLVFSATSLLGSRISEYYGNGKTGISKFTSDVIIENIDQGPYFDNSTSQMEIVEPNQIAYLHCIVNNINENTNPVSWVRQKDFSILTVGKQTYTRELRFKIVFLKETRDYVLQINAAQPHDTGEYECQVGTDPKISREVFLKVEEATALIRGDQSLLVNIGSTVKIVCEVSKPSVFVNWFHNGTKIRSSPDSKVDITKWNGSPTISTLTFTHARPSDAGLYTCDPSNAKPQNITLHLVEGEKASPMMRDNSSSISIHCHVYATINWAVLLFFHGVIHR